MTAIATNPFAVLADIAARRAWREAPPVPQSAPAGMSRTEAIRGLLRKDGPKNALACQISGLRSPRPGLFEHQGVVGVALSLSRQVRISFCALVEYGTEGCGVLAAGRKGGCGIAPLGVGEVVAQEVTLRASSISCNLILMGTGLGCIEGSYHLVGIFALDLAVFPLLAALVGHALKVDAGLHPQLPLHAGGRAQREDHQQQDQLGEGAHPISTGLLMSIHTCSPLAMAARTRCLTRESAGWLVPPTIDASVTRRPVSRHPSVSSALFPPCMRM